MQDPTDSARAPVRTWHAQWTHTRVQVAERSEQRKARDLYSLAAKLAAHRRMPKPDGLDRWKYPRRDLCLTIGVTDGANARGHRSLK